MFKGLKVGELVRAWEISLKEERVRSLGWKGVLPIHQSWE